VTCSASSRQPRSRGTREPAASPTREGRWYAATTTCFRRLVRNASCKERQATCHEASIESVSRQALADPGSFAERYHLLHQNTIPTSKLSCRQDHTVNASPLGTRSETVDRSFSCRPPRDIIVSAAGSCIDWPNYGEKP
jgi:hypothetical protein